LEARNPLLHSERDNGIKYYWKDDVSWIHRRLLLEFMKLLKYTA
jgi:hypothetical protein